MQSLGKSVGPGRGGQLRAGKGTGRLGGGGRAGVSVQKEEGPHLPSGLQRPLLGPHRHRVLAPPSTSPGLRSAPSRHLRGGLGGARRRGSGSGQGARSGPRDPRPAPRGSRPPPGAGLGRGPALPAPGSPEAPRPPEREVEPSPRRRAGGAGGVGSRPAAPRGESGPGRPAVGAAGASGRHPRAPRLHHGRLARAWGAVPRGGVRTAGWGKEERGGGGAAPAGGRAGSWGRLPGRAPGAAGRGRCGFTRLWWPSAV